MLVQSYTRVSEDASNASSGSIEVSEPDETWAFRQEFILIGKVTLDGVALLIMLVAIMDE